MGKRGVRAITIFNVYFFCFVDKVDKSFFMHTELTEIYTKLSTKKSL